MGSWKGEADASEEADGTGGGGGFEPAPRGFYTIQVADYKEGKTATQRDMITLTCEVADEGPEFGKKVWHNVTKIPKGEKGHGFMVLSLHAFGMVDGSTFDFEPNKFQGQTARALLGVKPLTKVKDGRTYTNMVNFVEALYTANHPEPAELPPAPAPRGSAVAAGVPVGARAEATQEEVPF